MECYVEDIVVKSCDKSDHLAELKKSIQNHEGTSTEDEPNQIFPGGGK